MQNLFGVHLKFLTELLSNCLKHAFPEEREGQIHVQLISEEEYLSIIFSDNGKGLPPEIDFKTPNTLGLQIVSMLADQLDGTARIKRGKQTTFIIKFKK